MNPSGVQFLQMIFNSPDDVNSIQFFFLNDFLSVEPIAFQIEAFLPPRYFDAYAIFFCVSFLLRNRLRLTVTT